jgi:hypothetical protein
VGEDLTMSVDIGIDPTSVSMADGPEDGFQAPKFVELEHDYVSPKSITLV